MFTLALFPEGGHVAVRADGQPSHGFPLADLVLTEAQAKEFLADPSRYGRRLFSLLFPDRSFARQALDALPLAPHPDGVLLLEVPPPAPGAPDLHSVPWEYLHDGTGFLATRYGMARALTPTPLPPSPSPARRERGRGWPEGPGEGVRVISLPADPLLWPGGEPAPYALGVEEEWAQMLAVLQEADPSLELVRVVPPTADALDEALAGVYGGIFHFTGHGDWDGRTAYLLFETPSGASDPVESGRVADILRGRVVLAVLSACRSATPGESREANLAALLAAQGTPFVLGMQLTVPDVSARRFTTRFYHYLFRGESVLEAVRRGRLAVLNDTALPRETRALVMGIPVLYVRGPGLPEFRRPEGKGLRVREPAPKVDLSGIPEPEAGFFGRNLDLVKIGEKLVARHGAERSAVITLYGTGGIGKTALLRKAAERFAWAFDGVLALPLEPLPTLADVLGRLERFLGIPEDPKLKPQERQERVAGALKRARVLLALDNFETLTRAGDEGNADARELQRFFRSLPARGTALLVSSRERTDLPGEQRVEVSGLDEGAGARLFSAHVSARRDALTEEGMRALSRRVGGHPLALKLLARRFDTGTEPLRDFVEGVEAVLPEAAERWDDGRRHDTLRACFDFSLAPLERREPALAEGLARLTIFSGPFIDQLAAPVLFGVERVQAAEQERRALFRQAAGILHRLWERGLLEREVVPLGPQAEETLYLYSVHPALAPFARARLTPEARARTEEGFFQAMQALAVRCWPLSEGGGVYGDPVLALLARLALPDLRRAARMRQDAGGSLLRFHAGFLHQHFGDLEGAMRLYQESLAIKESLGDLRGKAATLAMMGQVLLARGQPLEGVRALREALEILVGRGARADAERVAGILEGVRRELGEEVFGALWARGAG
ncbi:MAG: CHAT domain-containing protein [Anaerolineae bacterium]|nr:CHAT domain-containing protein [Anaerolineae bacterium]